MCFRSSLIFSSPTLFSSVRKKLVPVFMIPRIRTCARFPAFSCHRREIGDRHEYKNAASLPGAPAVDRRRDASGPPTASAIAVASTATRRVVAALPRRGLEATGSPSACETVFASDTSPPTARNATTKAHTTPRHPIVPPAAPHT